MRRSWKDRFKSAFGKWPYRCQMCSTRFTAPQDPESIAQFNADTEEDLRARAEEAEKERSSGDAPDGSDEK